MKCLNCGEELKTIQASQYPVGDNMQDVVFVCSNEHRFFIRVSADDLMEDS